MDTNTLYYGDCLDWMRKWDDHSIDLIYLDPPFNSDADYNMLFSNETRDSQYRAFTDTWTWDEAAADRYRIFANSLGRPSHNVIVGLYEFLGDSGMMAYLTYMAERLEQMYKLLKPTGSIYLHCDPTASHYLKLVMDSIFGRRKGSGFRSEIIWSNEDVSGFKSQAKNWIRGHDVLLYYLVGEQFTFNKEYLPLDDKTIKRYDKIDADGRRYKIYRNKKDGTERFSYLKEDRGAPVSNVWKDIPSFQKVNNTGEYLGYPTQKPKKLLERIISASSNVGDIVLDPFCGCGTTIDAARNLKRRWVGIDISSFAIDLVKNRRLNDPDIPVQGIPFGMTSAKQLATDNPFNFETWAISRIPGFIPNTKRVGDGGIDGRASLYQRPDQQSSPPPHPARSVRNSLPISYSNLALAQVKSGKFNLSALRDFIHVLDREKAAIGVYITLESITSKQARAEVANVGAVSVNGHEYRRLQLWSISDYFEDILPKLPIMNDPYTGDPLVQRSLFDKEFTTQDF